MAQVSNSTTMLVIAKSSLEMEEDQPHALKVDNLQDVSYDIGNDGLVSARSTHSVSLDQALNLNRAQASVDSAYATAASVSRQTKRSASRKRWEVLAEHGRNYKLQREESLSKLQRSLDDTQGLTFRPYVSERSLKLSERSKSRKEKRSNNDEVQTTGLESKTKSSERECFNTNSVHDRLYEHGSQKNREKVLQKLERTMKEEEKMAEMSFKPLMKSKKTFGRKDKRQIFAEPNGFETFIQKRKKEVALLSERRCQTARQEVEEKENLKFIPDTEVSVRSKGSRDTRKIFKQPGGSQRFIERSKQGQKLRQ